MIFDYDNSALAGAKEVSDMYFNSYTYQSLFLANMLRVAAEGFCEMSLNEEEFCYTFSVWQASKNFVDLKIYMGDEDLPGYTFSHENDISWTKCAEVYKKHNNWYITVREPELSKPIDFSEEDKDDPFLAMEKVWEEEKKINEQQFSK